MVGGATDSGRVSLIDTARCRWCLAEIVLNPFVAQWQTIPSSVCPDGPDTWKLHQPLVAYTSERIMGAMSDLLDVVRP